MDRPCEVCGKQLTQGFTDGGDFYSCDEHFEQAMTKCFGTWKELNEDEQDEFGYGAIDYFVYWCEELGSWVPTGVYWTDWR